MLVVDLACAHGHCFEGWFASADDLRSQQARGLLSCPVCGDSQVQRRPSAPRLNVSGACEPPSGAVTSGTNLAVGGAASTDGPQDQATSTLVQLQQLWLETVKKVVASTEDVGTQFVDEARRIHHGDAPLRAIRGQATPQEREELRDEGIDVLSLPVPDAFKGPLQ